MTIPLFREDPYLTRCDARVVAHTDAGGIILDRSVFYPTGGGQPGDQGHIAWDGGTCDVLDTVKAEGEAIVAVVATEQALPPLGAPVTLELNWDRRFAHMRVHTALHLLSVAIPFGVTGGSISAGKGRLDFDMEAPPEDKEAIAAQVNRMIESDAKVTEDWITEEELDAQPDLVKTLTVKPPRGSGRIRLIRIGDSHKPIDLQPCGGTHVKSLREIGRVRLGKVEKKGRMNRRVYLHLED